MSSGPLFFLGPTIAIIRTRTQDDVRMSYMYTPKRFVCIRTCYYTHADGRWKCGDLKSTTKEIHIEKKSGSLLAKAWRLTALTCTLVFFFYFFSAKVKAFSLFFLTIGMPYSHGAVPVKPHWRIIYLLFIFFFFAFQFQYSSSATCINQPSIYLKDFSFFFRLSCSFQKATYYIGIIHKWEGKGLLMSLSEIDVSWTFITIAQLTVTVP